MNCINQIILEGVTVGKKESRFPNGTLCCTLKVKTTRRYRTANNIETEESSYFDVENYGNLAELCSRDYSVGLVLRVVGRLKQYTWTDSAGYKKSRVAIISEHIEFKNKIEY